MIPKIPDWMQKVIVEKIQHLTWKLEQLRERSIKAQEQIKEINLEIEKYIPKLREAEELAKTFNVDLDRVDLY